MLAYFLHDLSPFIWDFGHGLGLRWYGFSYVLAFLVGGALYRWLAVRGYTDLPAEKVSDFITWAAVFGVMIGGRLGWVLFYGWQEVQENPWQLFRVWEGGMASHGGIIGLVIFTWFYARRHRISWTSIGDCLVVVAPLGLLFVRLANFINGELYGRVAGTVGKTDAVRWAMLFPKELGPEEPPLDLIQHDAATRAYLREILPPRHPSQLYEAFLEGVILFLALWFLRTRCRVPRGILTGAFFILYALLRIVGEIFREPDPAWHVGPISAGQFLSFFLVFIGVAFVIWGLRHPEYEKALQV